MADTNSGILIDVALTGDVKEFIKEIERELAKADLSGALDIEGEFKKQYKGVKTILDNLMKEIKKTQGSVASTDTLKQIQSLRNNLNLLEGTVKKIADSTSGAGLGNISSVMGKMSSDISEATKDLKSLESAAASTQKELNKPFDGTERMKEYQNQLDSTAASIENITKILNTKLNYNGMGIDDTISKLVEVSGKVDEFDTQLSNLNEKKKVMPIKDLEEAVQKYKEMAALISHLVKLGANDNTVISDNYNLKDMKSTLSEYKRALNTNFKFLKKNKDGNSQQVALKLKKGQAKSLENDILKVLERVQDKIYTKPIEIILTTATATYNREVKKSLDRLIERPDVDTKEIEALRDKLKKGFDKTGDIEIGINTRNAEKKIKDFIATVQGDMKDLKDQIGYVLGEISESWVAIDDKGNKRNIIKDQLDSAKAIQNSSDAIIEDSIEENYLLEKKIESLKEIRNLSETIASTQKISNPLEEKYNAFKPFYENDQVDTEQGARAALDYYIAYRNALYDKVNKGDLKKLTLGRMDDLFRGDYRKYKAGNEQLNMSGVNNQIKKYSESLKEINPSSVQIINSLSDALERLMKEGENSSPTTKFLEEFNLLLMSLKNTSKLLDIERLIIQLQDLKQVLNDGNVDLSFLQELNRYLVHSDELANLATILDIGGKEYLKNSKAFRMPPSILNKPDDAATLKENVSNILTEHGAMPFYMRMDTLKSGITQITSMVKDADGHFAKFIFNATDAHHVIVKEINDDEVALRKEIKAILAAQKAAEAAKIPNIGQDNEGIKIGTEEWDKAIELAREYGVEIEKIKKIVRNVDRGDESFQFYTYDDNRITLGKNSEEVLYFRDNIVDADKAAKQFGDNVKNAINNLKASFKTGGGIEVEDLKLNIEGLSEAYEKLVESSRALGTVGGGTEQAEQRFNAAKESMVTSLDKVLGLDKAYKYNQDYLNLAQELKDKFSAMINEQVVDYGKLEDILKEISATYSQLITKNQELANTTAIDKLLSRISRFTNTNSAMGAEYRNQFAAIESNIVKAGSTLTKSDYNAYLNDIIKLETRVQKEGKTGASVFDLLSTKVKGMSASWAAQYLSMYDIIRYVREIARTVTELDSAITELRKVSDASTSRLQQSFKTSADTAQELGSSITNIINATADWSRLGYDVDQAEELAKVAQLYVNVGDNLTMEDANQSLISTLQGYKIAADDAESIVDKFNEVANNYAIDSAGIGEALQRSAASFNAANTSLSESIALVTATNEVVQNPQKVGNMWKTVSARIRGATAELEDMGEDTDGVVTSTSKLQGLVKGITGFDIMQDENTFKSIYDIVVGIGEKWSSLNDINRAALLEALAGKVQSNSLAAALNNVDQLKAAYQTAETSEGSARREQENYEKSIQYSIEQARAKLETLATNILNSDTLKGIVSAGSDVLTVLNKITESVDLLTLALAGLFAYNGIKNQSGLTFFIRDMVAGVATIDKFDEQIRLASDDYAKLVDTINNGDGSIVKARDAIDKYSGGSNAIRRYILDDPEKKRTASELEQVRYGELAGSNGSYGGLTGAIKGISHYNSLLKDNKEAAHGFATGVGEQNMKLSKFLIGLNGANAGMGAYIKQAGLSAAKTLGLNIATGLAQGAIGMLVGVILNAGLTAFDNWIHRVEHAKEALEEMHDSYKETADKIKDQKELAKTVKDEYFELAKGVDTFNNRNLDLSDSDYEHFVDLNNQLAEMFPTLKSGIDDEGNAILNLGNNAEVASEKLQKLIDKNEEQARNKISSGLNEEFENTYTSLIEGDAYNQLQGNKKRLSDIDSYIARAKALGTNDQLDALFEASHQVKGKEPFAEVLQSMMNEGTYKEMIERINTASGNNPIRTALSEYTDQEVKNFLQAFNDELNTKQQNTQSDILAGDSEVDATLSAFGDHLVQVAKGTNSYMQLQDDKLRSLADYLLMNVSVDDMKKIQSENKGDPHVFIQRTVDLISGKSDEQQQKIIAAFGALQNTLNSSAELTLDEMYTQISDAINEIGKTLYGEKFTPEIAADLRKQFGAQGIYDTISTRDRIIAQGSGQDFGSAKASSFNTTRDFYAGALQNVMNNLKIDSDSELAKFSAALLDDTNKSLDSVVAAYKKAIDGANSSTKEAETDVLSFKEAWEGLDDVSEEDAGIFKRFSFNKDQIKDLSTFKEKVNELAQSGQLSVKAFKGLDGADEFIKAIGVSATEATDKINKMIDPVMQLSGMRTGITSITSAYDEKKDDPNKIVGADTLNSMYSGLGISEWGKKDLEVWERYKKAATDSSMSMKEFKKYQDDLATSYVNSGNFLANLTEENKDYYTALLTEMGVANATEVVENKLNAAYRAQAEAKKKINNVDLKKNAEGDIEGLTGLRNESHNVRAALLELWEQKNNVFSTPLETQESIDNLIALGREVGATAANLVYLNSLKRLQSGEIKGLGTEQINAIEQGAERAKKRILKNFDRETRLRTKTKITTNGGNQNDKNKEKKSSTDTKATATQIDWIEKKLTRLQGVISLTQAKLQNLFEVKAKNSNLNTQIKQNEKLLKSYSVGATKYAAKANRALNKIPKKLRGTIEKRYNTGALSSKTPLSQLIKTYGEKEAKRIQAYLDYVDKANNAKIGVQNTKKAIRDAKIAQQTNISNYEQQVIAAKEAEKANKQSAKDRNDILESEREHIRKNYNAQIKAAELEKDSYKVKELTEQKQKALLDNTIEQNTNLQQEADAYVAMYQAQQQNAKTSRTKNALVDKEIAKTKESYKYQIKIAELQGDSEKKAQLEAERDSKIVSLNKQRLDNTINYYSNLKKEATNAYTDIGNAINVITAKGLIAGEKLYKSQQAQNDARLKLLADEKKEAEENQKRIQRGTQEWYDSLDAIQALDDEIANLTTDNINLEKSIRAVKTAIMDLANANIDTLKAENELMLKYLSYGDMVKDGGYTAEGLATLEQTYENAEYARKQLENVQNRMRDYLAKKGKPYELLSGNERQEYDDLWKKELQYQNEYYDNMTKIADLEKQRLESYKNYLKELIDKRKQLLQAQKDEYDYEKTIAEKTQSIAILQKQIQSLNNDTSESANSRIQELQVQLDDANKDLRETEYNQWLSDQQSMLDGLYAEFESLLEKLEMDRAQLIKDAMTTVDQNTSVVASTLEKYMGENPEYTFSDYFKSVVGDETNGLQGINNNIIANTDAILRSAQGEVKDSASVAKSASDAQKVANNTVNSKTSSAKTTTPYDAAAQVIKDINSSAVVGKKITMKKDFKAYESPEKKAFSGYTAKKGKNYYVIETGKTDLGSTWLGLSKKHNSLDPKDLIGWVPKSYVKGYAKGGVVETLKRMPLANNDDAWITVGQGERILTPSQNAAFEKLMNNIDVLKPALAKNKPQVGTIDTSTTNIGDINLELNLPNVKNYDELVREMQRDSKFETLIKNIVIDKSSMSKYNVRW